MRPSLATSLLALLLIAPGLEAQALDQAMVPKGRLRLEALPVFDAWHQRYGRDENGARIENLGDDLSDPTGQRLFPGLATLRSSVRRVTGLSSYDPTVGSTSGIIAQDVTRVEVGGHMGVFDWLTIGVMVPWSRSRTEVQVDFMPDTVPGDLGLNPTISHPADVEAFLGSTLAAQSQAAANAAAMCGAGAGAACTAAQDLADRAASFNSSLEAAYGASPFFPLATTAGGDGLAQAAATLSSDLAAAGLSSLLPIVLADEVLTSEGFPLLPQVVGAGIDAAGLVSRKGVFKRGDAEVSARVRLLDNLTPREGQPRPGFGYQVTGQFLARLPTGEPENPDILLDIGAGDHQTDFEGSVAAQVILGYRVGLFAWGFYGEQRPTTLTKRVAPPEEVMPLASTLREVRWHPGSYVGGSVAPAFFVTPALVLHAEYRYFEKRRDAFELVDADPELDPTVLAIESGMKVHQFGGGLKYTTVEPWQRGEASKPMELHVRYLQTIDGSGGQTPRSTRIEAGVRLFRRFWGDR